MTQFNNDTTRTASILRSAEKNLAISLDHCDVVYEKDYPTESLSCLEERISGKIDAWGNELVFISIDAPYLLSSVGRDGIEGTGDDLIVRDGRVYISIESSVGVFQAKHAPYLWSLGCVLVIFVFLVSRKVIKKYYYNKII